MTVNIKCERVCLLSDKQESNLQHYYPRSFLADSIIIPNLQDQEFAQPISCNVEDQSNFGF